MNERYTANGITILYEDIQYCKMRSLLNPELRYFATLDSVSFDEEVLENILCFLREPRLSKNDVTEYGGIEEL